MVSEVGRVAELLTAMEAELRRLGLWSEVPPSAAALSSELPFCYDTLAFEQWLQWVFLPKTWRILEQGLELPRRSDIAPLAELYFSERRISALALIALIREFDRVVTRPD